MSPDFRRTLNWALGGIGALPLVVVGQLLFTGCAPAAPETAAAGDQAASSFMQSASDTDQLFDVLAEHDLAMSSIALSVGGVVRYQRAIGWDRRGPSERIPSTIHSRYRVASVSKLFTAVLVFQMIEEGALSLPDPLARYIPEIPGSDRITIGDLLYHRSGLPNYTQSEDFENWRYRTAPKDELVQIISRMSAAATPGSEHSYSNSNYLLLSYILEDISGTTYEHLLEDRILTPLELEDTYFEAAPDSTRRETRSYAYANSVWSEEQDDLVANHLGAGALVSTPSDLIVFLDALFAERLVSAESLERMTSFVGEYGMGLFVFQFGGRTGYGHGGRINENYTRLIHFPGEELSIAYATNGMVYPGDDILDGLVRIWVDEPYSTPNFSATIRPEEIDDYVGTYRSEPLQITVISKRVGDRLLLETSGADFEVQRYGPHQFVNFEHGYFFEFDLENGRLIVKEKDNMYPLSR